jgi:hypothetical protein
MATIYSDRLYRVVGLNGSSGPITVPLGETWVVRDIDAYTGATLTGTTLNFRDANTTGTIWSTTASPTQAQSSEWRGRQVFRGGDVFDFVTTSAWDIRVSGYRLTP